MKETIKAFYQKGRDNNEIKLVAFDLDGTIIRGRKFKYSWQLIWQYLKYPDDLRVHFFNDYEDKKISYEDWCFKCVEFFKIKNLKRSDFPKISHKLKVTKNLEETISALKLENIKTAIISGGVDTFLEELIPNYQDLFDYVFINKLIFDRDGKLETVVPTKYDFEGKINGILEICKKEKIEVSNCAYIGEEKNDRYVIDYFRKKKQGVTIAYPLRDTDVTNRANFRINRDDLLEILKYIIKSNQS